MDSKNQSYTLLNLEEKYIEFDEETYRLNMGANFEYNTNDLYYSYSSLTTPSKCFGVICLVEKKVVASEKSIGPFFSPIIMSQKGFGLEQMTAQRFPYRLSIKKERSLMRLLACFMLMDRMDIPFQTILAPLG